MGYWLCSFGAPCIFIVFEPFFCDKKRQLISWKKFACLSSPVQFFASLTIHVFARERSGFAHGVFKIILIQLPTHIHTHSHSPFETDQKRKKTPVPIRLNNQKIK